MTFGVGEHDPAGATGPEVRPGGAELRGSAFEVAVDLPQRPVN
ncbi:hypothetical protein ABZ342_20470 [Amycolatopsis sp. NPDC005961]